MKFEHSIKPEDKTFLALLIEKLLTIKNINVKIEVKLIKGDEHDKQ